MDGHQILCPMYEKLDEIQMINIWLGVLCAQHTQVQTSLKTRRPNKTHTVYVVLFYYEMSFK
jgi:hypothetical protein